MSKFNITNIEAIKGQLQSVVNDKVMPIVLKESFENIIPDINEVIIEILEKTQVWQGLLGEYAGDTQLDVQAILGVQTDEALSVLSNIRSIIQNSLRVTNISARSGGSFSKVSNATNISFRITTEDLEGQILNIADGSYTSSKGFEIPWLQWIIEGGSVSGYDVVFDFYNIFSGRKGIAGFSRTGRAIMLPFGNWSTQEYNQWSESGTNFLDDILQNPELTERITSLLLREVQRVLKTKRFTV